MMPKFRVTSPEGKTYEVNAPDGATQQDAIAYIQGQLGQSRPDFSNVQSQATEGPSSDVMTVRASDQSPSLGQQFHDVVADSPIGHVLGMQSEGTQPQVLQDLARTGKQTTRNLLEGVASVPDIVLAPVNYLTGGRTGTAGQVADIAANAMGATNPQDMTASERFVGAATRGFGGMLGGMGLGGVMSGASNPAVAAMGNAMASNPGAQLAGVTGASTAAQGAKEAGAGEGLQLAAGLAGGVLGGLGPSLASSGARNAAVALTPVDAAGQQLAQEALARGIPLKASQLANTKAGNFLDSASGSLPFSGAQKFTEVQRSAFNRALSKTIGADSDAITPQVFDKARQQTSQLYDDLWSRNNMLLTNDLKQKIDGIIQQASIYDPSVGAQIQGALNRISGNATLQNGRLYLPGAAFKALDSDLGQASAAGGTGSNLVADLRYTLRDAMQRGMTAKDQELASTANRQWANQEAIQPLVAKASSFGGDISPADLMARVTSDYAGKRSMARGSRGEIGTLAQIGQRFLKATPSSGTAERAQAYRALGDAGKLGAAFLAGNIVDPLTGLASAGTALAGARGIQNILQNQNIVRQAAGLQAQTPDYINLFTGNIVPTTQGTQATQRN